MKGVRDQSSTRVQWVPDGESRDQQRLKSEVMMLGREDQR